MSAYIVDRDVIDVIVAAMARSYPRPLGRSELDAAGRRLWAANLASVAYRYPDCRDGDRPGPVGFADADVARYVFTDPLVTDPQVVADAAAEYAYQSCERPEWDASPLAQAVEELRRALAERQAAELDRAVREAQATAPHADYDTRQTAAELRRALRARFPGVKFSVRMARGTAYGWLDLSWTDGPTPAAVDAVKVGFLSEQFDGMTDSYHRIPPALHLVDGVPTEARYSCCGINCSRTLSDAALAWARRQVDADPGRWANAYDRPGETYYACRMLLNSTDLRGVAV